MLDAILRQRFHGAVNIKGIRYQLLYSLLRALEMYSDSSTLRSIRFEGIEDLDLLGLHLGTNYVQVKTSQTSWNWAKLGEPLANFAEVLRADASSRFVLAVDFPLTSDLARLTELNRLPSKEIKRVTNKFQELCKRNGMNRSEADELLKRLTIISISEEQIQRELRQVLTNVYNLSGSVVDVYVSILIAKCLDWAYERKEITKVELNIVRDTVATGLAREIEFEAYGRGLIGKIEWTPDEAVDDFFDGKDTRPGHIAAGVDIVRPIWMQRIDQVINSARICIIRSASGQGKSTLLYRYAHDYWASEHTLVLRVAESPEHVEMVRHYLRFRVDVGLPTFLLIDGANRSTKLWSLVVQECASLGIPVIVAVRQEDWSRFAQRSLIGYEVIEPYLDIEEAKRIFYVLQREKKLHVSVVSPEWAYERTGSPKLLMEYLYLLTHGQMLEERLRDQLQQLYELNEDPAKVEILRRTALADVLGAPVQVELLINNISLSRDVQQILESLSGEYVRLENRQLYGYHRVRSEHLAQILHEGYPSPMDTVIAIFPTIPIEYISTFIANTLIYPGIDTNIFLKRLAQLRELTESQTVLSVIMGLFEAGERKYFIHNLSCFDEAHNLAGPSGVLLLSSEVLPIVKNNFLMQMSEIIKDELGDNYRRLLTLSDKIQNVPRGLDLCHSFMSSLKLNLVAILADKKLKELGQLLDWYSLCNLEIGAWEDFKRQLPSVEITADLLIGDLAAFAQGLYRFDEEIYQEWFSLNRKDITGFLKLQLTCATLEIEGNNMQIEFMPEFTGNSSVHEQTMTRLNLLRSILPFCETYRSQALWNLPFGLIPSVDDSTIAIQRSALHFESDIEKNVVWTTTVEDKYLPDSYYNYQEYWYRLRKSTLTFAQGFSKVLLQNLKGEPSSTSSFDSSLHASTVFDLAQRAPRLPPQTDEDFARAHNKICTSWSSSLHTFIRQISKYSENTKDKREGQLALHNLGEVVNDLHEFQDSFARLFQLSADYFSAADLCKTEIAAYGLLRDILEAVIREPYIFKRSDPLTFIRERQERIQKEKLKKIQSAVENLNMRGITLILPTAIYKEHPLLSLPLAFTVNNPCHPEVELEEVIESIHQVHEMVDYWYLIPLYKGIRFIEGAYCFSSTTIKELVDTGENRMWETLIPRPISQDILELLPPIPLQKVIQVETRTKLLEVVANLDMHFRIQAVLSKLPAITDWGRALYEKFEAKLLLIRQQVCEATSSAQELITQMVQEYPEYSNSANEIYLDVTARVAIVKMACDENRFDNLLSQLDLEDFYKLTELWIASRSSNS